jgi:hypothetical protein
VALDKPFIINGVEMMHPHDPKAPAAEIINCGCRALYRPRDWKTAQPDHMPYTGSERTAHPILDAAAKARQAVNTPMSAHSDKIAAMPKPARTPWNDFPDAALHAPESAVKHHPDYAAAKAGDVSAAVRLVADTLDDASVARLRALAGDTAPRLVGVHAVESQSVNVIPVALAATLSGRLAWPVETGIIQINRVGHTGADGYHRLAAPALFGGIVEAQAPYVLVDDFIGQGGTLANLRGYIEEQGGVVVAATVLTGKPYSATLTVSSTTLEKLREKHGKLEDWWRQHYGYGFELLTESEARYLERSADADAIRTKLLAASPPGGAR